MEEKSIMMVIYLLFGMAILLVVIGLLAYTGQLKFPKLDFWGMLGSFFDLLEGALPPI